MTNKLTGLKTFGMRPMPEQPPSLQEINEATVEAAHPKRRMGKGKAEVVFVGVRLKRSDWLRLHELARADGVSLQQLIETGLSRVLNDIGLPPVSRWNE